MCGRFGRFASWDALREWFDLFAETPLNLEPRYNIAPTQDVAIIGKTPRGRELRMAHWGLVPGWAKDATLASRMINARAETVMEKPAFRAAFKRRRCLVPADGFYEWQKTEGGKQPWWIYQKEGELLSFAGLWEENETLGLRSCTIITTDANAFMRPLHHRMPLLLRPEAFDVWIDPDAPLDEVVDLLAPYDADDLAAYTVSKQVNSPANDSPQNIEPL